MDDHARWGEVPYDSSGNPIGGRADGELLIVEPEDLGEGETAHYQMTQDDADAVLRLEPSIDITIAPYVQLEIWYNVRLYDHALLSYEGQMTLGSDSSLVVKERSVAEQIAGELKTDAGRKIVTVAMDSWSTVLWSAPPNSDGPYFSEPWSKSPITDLSDVRVSDNNGAGLFYGTYYLANPEVIPTGGRFDISPDCTLFIEKSAVDIFTRDVSISVSDGGTLKVFNGEDGYDTVVGPASAAPWFIGSLELNFSQHKLFCQGSVPGNSYAAFCIGDVEECWRPRTVFPQLEIAGTLDLEGVEEIRNTDSSGLSGGETLRVASTGSVIVPRGCVINQPEPFDWVEGFFVNGSVILKDGSAFDGYLRVDKGGTVVVEGDDPKVRQLHVLLNEPGARIFADSDISARIEGEYREASSKLFDGTTYRYGWEYAANSADDAGASQSGGATGGGASTGGTASGTPEAGASVVTVKNLDGSTMTVTLDADGSITRRTERPDGSTTVIVEQADRSATESTLFANGMTVRVQRSAGGVLAEAAVSVPDAAAAAALAEGAAVRIPGLAGIVDAAPVSFDTPAGTKVAFEVPNTLAADAGLVVVAGAAGEPGVPVPKTSVNGTTVTAILSSGNESIMVRSSNLSFVDAKGGEWYVSTARAIAARGLIKGVDRDGTVVFDGNAPMTRAMVAAVLQRLEGGRATSKESFPDVDSGAWYAEPMAWASESELILGSNGSGLPNAHVTREQLAVMMMRYAELLGMDTSARVPLAAYEDASDLAFGKDAMSWAVACGIFRGYEGAHALGGSNSSSRAETSAVILRFIDLML